MKCFILGSVVFVLSLSAQDSSVRTTTSVDINGNRVADGPQIEQTRSKGTAETTERMQSINGRMVPLERVEERVVRDDSTGRVVERTIHRYDATGNPTTPVKETIEEQKRPDGSSTIQTTRYRGDVNGDLQLVQKTVTELRKSGSTETSDTRSAAAVEWVARDGGEEGNRARQRREQWLSRGRYHLSPRR